MKVKSSFLLGLFITANTLYHIYQGLQFWLPRALNECASSQIKYTGTHWIDQYICVGVRFVQQPLTDWIGLPMTALWVASMASLMIWMGLESSRHKFNESPNLLACYPLFALLAHVVGLTAVFSVVWVPLNIYYRRQFPLMEDWSVTSKSRVYGVLTGVFVGYIVPSIFLVLYPTPHLIALSTFLPLLTVPIMSFAEHCFSYQESAPGLADRLEVAEGKEAVETIYLFLGVTNFVLYFVLYFTLGIHGIHVKDAFLMILGSPYHLPMTISDVDMGRLLTTRSILIDILGFAFTGIVWVAFNHGILAALIVTAVTPFIGPAAALSLYSYYRENQIQNLSVDSVATQTTITKDTIKITKDAAN
ncbi:hypothetical protein BDB01DRAFT_726527 [Pilobolus umbonatus]|nr:hypothetical protein BDB01DRAFT_726527 [Pilobolus umbonatus]